MNPTDKKVINACIKQLLASLMKKTASGCRRSSSHFGLFVKVDSAAGLPLKSIGMHIQLNNFDQWIVYLSIWFARTAISYEGLAYCTIETLDSIGKLKRWLSSKATVKSVYEEMSRLFDAYMSNQWLDGNPPTPLANPTDSNEVFYEVWYRALFSWDPLYFSGRTDSLMKALQQLFREGKKELSSSQIKQYGYYFAYVFYPEDIAYRREYIRQHDETLLNSVNNFTEPVLQDMQNVCYEICAKALSEFDPDKDVNDWVDDRYEAGLRIEKDTYPADEDEDSPSMYYWSSIRLRVPEGLYAFEKGSCDTAEEMREWLSHYTHNPWVVNCLSKKTYEDCVRDACLGIPSVYMTDEVV